VIRKIETEIDELNLMKKYPKELFYIGNLNLLSRKKISIVGTRRPISYTKNMTRLLASKLSSKGVCIVSGGAMGVDALAHLGATPSSTIMVAANGLDSRIPSINQELIKSIEKEGLTLSQFKEGFSATRYSFVIRNELVVALGDVVIITEAALKSGSMRSAEFALKMGKEIFVLPHRVGDSEGTNDLLKKNLAKPIYNIEEFVNNFGEMEAEEEFEEIKDEFLEYCKTFPKYDEAISKYGNRVLDYEINGTITIENNTIKLI